jgi:RNA polymerase sigma-70 factor, ECF subfamily
MRHPASSLANGAIRADEDIEDIEDIACDATDSGDTSLILAAQADITAFDALYDRYLPRVYRYLRAHARDEEEATDLTQLVFLRALEALPRYQPRGVPFAVWLFRIARHAAIDAHRRRRWTVPLEALTQAPHLDSNEPLDQTLIRQEELERLRREVSRLSSEQQELLALSFAAGLAAPEIASVLSMKPDAVRKRLSRTIRALKEQYHAS